MKTRFVLCVTALLAPFFACGGKVELPGGGAPDAATTTPTTTTPTTTPTTSGTSTPSSCAFTDDAAAITVTGARGSLGCDGSGVGTLDFDGQVYSTTSSALAIDTCPPNANCIAITNVTVGAPGLDLTHFPRAAGGQYPFVHVHAIASRNFYCTAQIEVTALPSWEGFSNPVEGLPPGVPLLAAADGVLLDDAPNLSVTLTPLGCGPGGPNCSANPVDDFALDFAYDGRVDSAKMGETTSEIYTSAPNGASLTAEMRNLRAYNTGACDDDRNYAWWFTLATPP